MATLHMMVGLPCSGKSTEARRLAKALPALLLSPDGWHLRLYGSDLDDRALHDIRHGTVEALQWDLAVQALSLGVDVILDYGFWAREEREDFRARARAAGAKTMLHPQEPPREELLRRLDARNANLPEGVFLIPRETMEGYMAVYQPIEADETLSDED